MSLGPPLIDRRWPVDESNPKAAVLLRRLQKTRAHRETWRREIAMLSRIISGRVGSAARVLEVGSGTGFSVLELASLGFKCAGIDFDPNLSRLTAQSATHFGLSVECVSADGCAIPFATGSFDVVLSRSYFEHVYDFERALSEQSRCLRVGGILVLLDGNLWNPKLLFDLLVMYPIRTRGAHGGLKWALHKNRAYADLYGYLALGKDENIKSVRWWRRRLERTSGLALVEATTSAKYLHPNIPVLLRPFVGACLVIAEKST